MMPAAIPQAPVTPAANGNSAPVSVQPRSLARIGGVQQGQPEMVPVTADAINPLAGYVQQCFSDAKLAKESVTARLLKCERQRRGEYDPDILSEIREAGSNEIYMMLTDIKCRAAAAWMADVMTGGGKNDTFTVRPTAEPDLPDEVRNEVIQAVFQEIQQTEMAGIPVPNEAVEMRLSELHTQVGEALGAEALRRAVKMETRIRDIFQEGGWDLVEREAIDDFVTFPTAIVKGPILLKKQRMKWGPAFRPVIDEVAVRSFRRVSPYNIFPGPGSTGPDDSYLCERHILRRAHLQGFIGQPGYDDKAIKELLERFDDKNVRMWLSGDDEKNRLDGKTNTWYARNEIEAVEFWGPISGRRLMDWGMKGLDPYKDYEANVWVVANYVIRAVLNADPLGRRPYSTASFVHIPGSFWGKALPELMTDVQRMCNAAARALANNMAMASGPMVEVAVDRLPPGQDIEGIHPWKMFQTTSDKTGGGQGAIRFFQPDMNADKLLQVYQYFQKVADEVTGVPNYVYGSTQVGGAGRTASGLAMLMENAAKGIKHAILYFDAAKARCVTRVFEHLMIYDADTEIKGDMTILPAGIVATLVKDGLQEKRLAFLQATANPIDAQIVGLPGRAAVLRETAKTLDMDVDDLVPDPKKLKQQLLMQQMLQAQAQAQAPAPDQPPQ